MINDQSPAIEPWFAALVDAERPPRTFEEAVERGVERHVNWRTLLPPGEALRIDWANGNVNAALPSVKWWPELDAPCRVGFTASPFLHAVAYALVLLQSAMCGTPGMAAIVERWVANRRRGSAADSNTVPLLPRESAAYRTTMTDATDAERVAMRDYDVAVDALLDATAAPIWVCVATLSAVYVLGLAGFEARVTARTMALLSAPGVDDTARRAALGMPTYHQFESPAIEAMTMESVAAATAAGE